MEKRILEIAASSLIKMRNTSKDSNVVINEITFEVEGYRFYAEKFPNLDEFSLQTENGEVVKLAPRKRKSINNIMITNSRMGGVVSTMLGKEGVIKK